MAARSDQPAHSCECMCQTCERTGAGFFAQRAALAGDPTAEKRLSQPIAALLTAERTKRRPKGGQACGQR